MSDVVRHGTIIIDLKAGKVELPAPNLVQMLQQKKADLEIEQRANEQREASLLLAVKQKKAMDDVEQQHRRAAVAARESAFAHVRAWNDSAEGAFRLTRSMTLLGVSSEDTLNSMVRKLAAVQSGIDMFKGGSQTIKGLTMAFGGSEAAAGALLTKLNPTLAVISAMATAFGLWTEATRAQTEAEQELADALEAQKKARDAARAGLQSELDRARELEMETATPERKEQLLEMIQAERQARVARLESLNERNPFEFEANPNPANAWFFNLSPTQRETRIQNARNNLTESTQELDGFRRDMVEESRRQLEKQANELMDMFGRVLRNLSSLDRSHNGLVDVVRQMNMP